MRCFRVSATSLFAAGSLFTIAICAICSAFPSATLGYCEEGKNRGEIFAVMARYYPGHAADAGEPAWQLHIEADQTAVQLVHKDGSLASSARSLQTKDLDDIVRSIDEADFFKMKKVYGTGFGFGFVLRVTLRGKTHSVDFDPVNMGKADKPDFDRFMKIWETVERVVPPPGR